MLKFQVGCKRPQCSLSAAPNQRMHTVRALAGVDRLQVHQVARNTKFFAGAVAARYVARQSGNVQCHVSTAALDKQCAALHQGRASVLHAAKLQADLQADGDFGLHVGPLFLNALIGSQRAAKLLAVQRVLACGVPAEFGRTQRAPGNTIARY